MTAVSADYANPHLSNSMDSGTYGSLRWLLKKQYLNLSSMFGFIEIALRGRYSSLDFCKKYKMSEVEIPFVAERNF